MKEVSKNGWCKHRFNGQIANSGNHLTIYFVKEVKPWIVAQAPAPPESKQ
jgi:hypothetical protein